VNYNKTPLNIALTIALVGMSNASHAAENDNKNKAALEVIEVTAQKRVQNLQELPTAVSVFNSESLREKGITDVEDLSIYTPNMQISETPGGSTGATIAIRGSVTINPAVTWEPTTGVYIDGVFVSKNIGGLFDVAAIERVEVLRGPQGTLYGKNTIGGALSIMTRKPSGELGGEVRVGAGNYGMKDLYISADSAQINDKLSSNITANKKRVMVFMTTYLLTLM
jgi:iron complex outermembrane receptor protein